MSDFFRVTERIDGTHPKHPDYPLLDGDVLTRTADGTWTKHTGLGMIGFELTPEQAATLEPMPAYGNGWTLGRA